jgi:general secretion pathway protein G
MQNNRKGFSLIELIIVIAVISVLAVGMMSAWKAHLNNARKNRAKEDIQQIATAITAFYTDVGSYPGAPTYNVMSGSGLTSVYSVSFATGSGWAGYTAGILSGCLVSNDYGYANWKGKYLPSDIKLDPWGRQYYLLRAPTGGNVFLLSAGPNGTIDTTTGANGLIGDDVGILLY